jgi:hypothetical protein
MLRKSLALIAALGIAGGGAPSAQADLCFHYGSGGGIAVAKGADLPPANQCESLAMFEVGGAWGAATGSICTDRNGATALWHYVYHGCVGRHYFETGTCAINLKQGLPSFGTACNLTFSDLPATTAPSGPVTGHFDDSLTVSKCDGVDTNLPERFPSLVCDRSALPDRLQER